MQEAANPIKLLPLEGDELINPRGFLNVLLGNDYFATRPDELLGNIRRRSSGRRLHETVALGGVIEQTIKQAIKPLGITGEALSVDEIRELRQQLRQEVTEVLESVKEVARCLTNVRHQWINARD